MKTISFLLVAILIGTSKNFANPASHDNDQSSTIIQSLQTPPGDTIIVPVAIRNSFMTMYPNASRVVWYRYTPFETTLEPGVWYYTMDTSDYYVSFNWDDADYIAWYDNGSWIRSTQRIDNTELPDVVSRVISSEYPGYVITDVDFERDNKQNLYEVKLVKGNQKWNLHLTPAGAIVKKKSSTLNTATAGTDMMTDFQTRYPNASGVTWYSYYPDERVEVLPSDWDYNMDASDYEVRFTADGSDYVAYYDNGKWIRSETLTYSQKNLPSTVNQAITRDFAGYSIKDVDREDNINQVLYEVELQKGTDKCKIHYTADGSVVKKKCKVDGVKTKSKS